MVSTISSLPKGKSLQADGRPRACGSHLDLPIKRYHDRLYDRLSILNSGFDGTGKTVLITDGAFGISFAIAQAFAKAHVEHIIIIDRDQDALHDAQIGLEDAFPKVRVTTYCVSIEDHLRTCSIMRKIRHVDILVLGEYISQLHLPNRGDCSPMLHHVFHAEVVARLAVVETFLSLSKSTDTDQKTIMNMTSLSDQGIKATFMQIMQDLAAQEKQNPADERVRMFNYHTGSILKRGTLGDINLPAYFAVWLASPQSDFLHGRFVSAQWDVGESMDLRDEVEANPELLTIGLIR